MMEETGFLNAFTFGFCEKRSFTLGSAWKRSLELMAGTTLCNAVILPVCAWQDHCYSTRITSKGPEVMDAADVERVCAHARALGLRVILKAMVNCRDGYWRAYIRFFDAPVPTEPGWGDWFPAWEEHVVSVAEMARDNRADLLCIGCEMVGTDHRAEEWRHLCRRVREVYPGPITYNCDKYQEDRVTWWDAVDVISSSGYYPIDGIEQNLERIRGAALRAGKPFMFMECGCPSRGRSEYRPNDWRYGEGCDPEAQRRWYEAFLAEVLKYPFVRGVGWWDWPATRLYPEYAGADDSGYCTFGKPAQEALRRFAQALRAQEKR